MNLDNLPEVAATRLLWREQLAALPQSLWHALRRLFRAEPRVYLTMNGQVVARFVSDQQALEHMNWIGITHERAFDFGFATGKEHKVAVYLAEERANAGDPGTT